MRGLTNRLGMGHVVLLPLHERLHIRWRNQSDLVAKPTKFVPSMMRTATSLDGDDALERLGEERKKLVTSELLAQYNCTMAVSAVHLKNVFRQTQPNRGNLSTDASLVFCNTTTLAHRCR